MNFIEESISQNKHWVSGAFELPHAPAIIVKREVEQAAEQSLSRKFITILKGMRRTGKSFLARRLAQAKLANATSPKEVGWFEFDRAMNTSPDDLAALIKFFQSEGCKTIFLDEIIFVPMWQDVLKRFYDQSELKFVVTGSSALEFDKRSAESLAGRFELLEVRPFSLPERMALGGLNPPANELEQVQMKQKMGLECDQYLGSGGLPEITLEQDPVRARDYVKTSLLDPLFYKEFGAVFPKANPDLLYKSLELLSATVGSTYQIQNISRSLGCSHPLASTQVGLLEKTLLVKTAYNLTASIAKQKRTAKKIVFSDNAVLKCLNESLEKPRLAENALLYALDARFFWRDSVGREIDAVLPQANTAVELKYSNNVSTDDEKNLRHFLEKKPGWKGVLVTKGEQDDGDIRRVPLWKVLLEPSKMSAKGRQGIGAAAKASN